MNKFPDLKKQIEEAQGRNKYSAGSSVEEPPETIQGDYNGPSGAIINVLDPLTIAGEQVRLLRSKLNVMQKERGTRTLLVTSSVQQEGKTFMVFGLAGVFAQEEGKRILVIDADMRKAGSGWDFGFRTKITDPGLSQVLGGDVEFNNALLVSQNPELYFLPSGPLPSHPLELLSSPKLEDILKAAAEFFDWVIVDSPPAVALSDATLLSQLCDAALLIVRANSTSSKLVTDTIGRIGRDKICGIVINRQKQIRSSRHYYEYYDRSSKRRKA